MRMRMHDDATKSYLPAAAAKAMAIHADATPAKDPINANAVNSANRTPNDVIVQRYATAMAFAESLSAMTALLGFSFVIAQARVCERIRSVPSGASVASSIANPNAAL